MSAREDVEDIVRLLVLDLIEHGYYRQAYCVSRCKDRMVEAATSGNLGAVICVR